ncbi:MAG: SHOCT domain-containing protein [Gammaproteobacteria bacterium]|nr:SHOCT domain-containing protein [Gammaproteobacteria bacterium]
MQQLTPAGQNIVNDLSFRYGLSQDAVVHMMIAVNNGAGSMAQFYCPELGGGGQWMRGGMTMVGDMFNHGLKATVDNLCNELSNALANNQIFAPAPVGSRHSSQWWPGDLGSPFSSGAQNNIRYAVFPNRIAVELNGQVTVYDTLNHSIGGVSQQQGGDTSLSFSSQFGTVSVSSLPIVSGAGLPPAAQTHFAVPSPSNTQPPQNPESYAASPAQSAGPLPSSTDDMIALIEKLARLRDAGALTDDEFNAKKGELLSRI